MGGEDQSFRWEEEEVMAVVSACQFVCLERAEGSTARGGHGSTGSTEVSVALLARELSRAGESAAACLVHSASALARHSLSL